MKTVMTGLLLFGCCLFAAGQRVDLLSLAQLQQRIHNGKDTTFVLNFWATWCAPCVRELPFFDALGRRYKTDQLAVLLVSVDGPAKRKAQVVPFAVQHKLRSPVCVLNELDPQTYIDRVDPTWSGSIPATLLIKGDRRAFFEQEFTFSELEKAYVNFK